MGDKLAAATRGMVARGWRVAASEAADTLARAAPAACARRRAPSSRRRRALASRGLSVLADGICRRGACRGAPP
eukprot:4718982-Lingulodinium_polyedra.AAC.1